MVHYMTAGVPSRAEPSRTLLSTLLAARLAGAGQGLFQVHRAELPVKKCITAKQSDLICSGCPLGTAQPVGYQSDMTANETSSLQKHGGCRQTYTVRDTGRLELVDS